MAKEKTATRESQESRSNVNWAARDTQIKFDGKQIVLPGDPEEMEYDEAIATIQRVKEQESQKFDVNEVVKGAPWDALVALYKACQEIYGVVTSHSIKTWFGEVKPEFVTINTGPNDMDRLQVPKGLMKVPGVKEPFYLDFYGSEGAVLYGTVNKRDQSRLVEIANLARKLIKTDSVYKGKAIKLPVDDSGELDMSSQPEFIDLAHVSESDMIHTKETATLIRTNIMTPLKNTEGCRLHKVPLKRGILLEGQYGTGKSLTARVTAKVAIDNNWTFIMLSRSQGLHSAIEFGRAYQPCVIFAEDIDRASDREDESVNDLVNLIDGVITKDMEMMVVLTTNFIEQVDQALLRPGRFDAIISIQTPDAETAIKLIKAYARDLLAPNVNLDRIGSLIDGQIPAIIREVVEKSKLSMLAEGRDSLSEDDLYASALSMVRQMELLRPKGAKKSSRDLMIDGFMGVVRESVEGTDGSSEDVLSMLRNVYSKVNSESASLGRMIGGVNAQASAAAAAAGQARDEVKKLGGKKAGSPAF